jgi:hypothetical protein
MNTLLLLFCLVTNNTDRPLVELYCTPAFSSIPGVNLFDQEDDDPIVLEPGKSRRIYFEPLLASPYWDIVAVDDAGYVYRFSGLPKDRLAVVVNTSRQTSNDSDAAETYEGLDDFDALEDFDLLDDFDGPGDFD